MTRQDPQNLTGLATSRSTTIWFEGQLDAIRLLTEQVAHFLELHKQAAAAEELRLATRQIRRCKTLLVEENKDAKE